MEKLRDELEKHPLTVKLRQDQSAEILAKRREIAARIEDLRREESTVLPKLQADLEEKEARHTAAKAAQEAAAEEVRVASLALRRERLTFSTSIGKFEAELIDSADPAIGEATAFFQSKLDFLRTPGRISRNAIGSEKNIFSWKKRTFEESNVQAVHEALAFCRAAILELERMKLCPELDLEKIEELKGKIPQIDVYREYVGEKPMERINTDPRSLLPSDSQMEWELGELNEKIKKLMKR